MNVTSVLLGALGCLLLTAIAAVLMPSLSDLFGQRADKVALATLWVITLALTGTAVWAGVSLGFDDGAFGATAAVAVLFAVVAGTQMSWHLSTHDRKSKAHDPGRTQPDPGPTDASPRA